MILELKVNFILICAKFDHLALKSSQMIFVITFKSWIDVNHVLIKVRFLSLKNALMICDESLSLLQPNASDQSFLFLREFILLAVVDPCVEKFPLTQ